MNEHLPKDPVTLDELRRAIEAVPVLATDVKAYVFQTARAEAWRVAFEWRDSFTSTRTVNLLQPEFVEGMRMIRESLK